MVLRSRELHPRNDDDDGIDILRPHCKVGALCNSAVHVCLCMLIMLIIHSSIASAYINCHSMLVMFVHYMTLHKNRKVFFLSIV